MKHVKLFEGFLNEGFDTGSTTVRFSSGHVSPYEKNILNNLKKEGFIKLGEEIHSVLGPTSRIELFSSGYFGLHITCNGQEFYIMDQPGRVGLEDQSMPYIQLKKKGSDPIISASPEYFSRSFGSTGMDPEMRKKAYEDILEYFKDEYETITKK